MPKSVLLRPAIDKPRALILERKRQYRKTNADMAKCLGYSERKWQDMVNTGTGTWSVNDLFKVARYLDIPKEDIKNLL